MEILRSYGGAPELRWVSERDRGVVEAVNKGLASARGDVLAIQSSDDLYLPDAVEAAVAVLEERSDLAFVYGDVEYVDADGVVTGRTDLAPWSIRSFLGKDLYVNQAAAFFRSWAAREVGMWEEDVAYAADSDYWLRMGLRFPARKIDRLLARYRYHDAQRDKAGTRPARDWEKAVRRRMASREIAPELIRVARRGIHLTWHHYTPEKDWKSRTASLYRALLSDPPALLKEGFPKRELLPGREPIWKALSWTKRRLGTLAFDRPRLAWPLLRPGGAGRRWRGFQNRGEGLVPNPNGDGYDCDWRWTSDLTLARVFPSAGRRLLAAALTDQPVRLAASRVTAQTSAPDVSFVIGHRGEARLPLLQATLQSLLAQTRCSSEVIVVEQSPDPLLPGRLPADVRLVHQSPPKAGMPYSRSWAFNAGAREAKGRVLVFHDNDVLAPEDYASELLRLAAEGFEAFRIQRFVFYLDEGSTASVVAGRGPGPLDLKGLQPELVRQNCQGHTIAVTREAYFRIGGHDEGFLGWGGEDNEFFDRCRLLRFHPWGYLPFIHLWHAPQPGKSNPAATLAHLETVIAVPREERARRLAALPIGSPDGPRLGRGA